MIGDSRRPTKKAALAAAAVWAVLGITGCGGGGGGTPDPETSRASLTIQWPARSRATLSPSSALSAVVRIVGADPSSNDIVFNINRDTVRANGYSAQYSSPTDSRVGEFTVTITFHSQADGQGGVVGSVSRIVTLSGGSNSLGDVAVEGTVASVSVAPRQTIFTNESANLVFTAFDTSINAIAGVTPGSAFFTVSGGKDILSVVDGQLKAGATPGVASVIVMVDGKISEEQRVAVGSAVSSLTVAGARGTIPLVASVEDFVGGVTATRGAISSDQPLSVTGNWFYPHKITTPAGYGDRKFDHWAQGSVSVSSEPAYNYVPANIVGDLEFTAVYTPRAYPAGGFTPNFSRAEFLHWAQFPLRVSIANPELVGRMRAGLDKWVAATGGVISYEIVDDPALADIRFTLGTPSGDRKGLTTVDFDPDSREILHADVVLLQSAPAETHPTGIDLLALYTAHEFGHALGMTASAEAGAGHSTNPRDTMFPLANASDPFITEQDINTLENIYPTLFNGGMSRPGTRAAIAARRNGKAAKITVHCP